MATLHYYPDYAREYFGYVDEVEDDLPYGVRRIIDPELPARAGMTIGALAGPIAFSTVHAGAAGAVNGLLLSAAHARSVNLAVSVFVAYATSAALGAVIGSTFAVVTRYLRKLGPLVVWALVFFVSLAVLLLSIADRYGRPATASLSGAVVLGAAVFGALVSFSLPFQRRG
jgi:hypothetical protein